MCYPHLISKQAEYELPPARHPGNLLVFLIGVHNIEPPVGVIGIGIGCARGSLILVGREDGDAAREGVAARHGGKGEAVHL